MYLLGRRKIEQLSPNKNGLDNNSNQRNVHSKSPSHSNQSTPSRSPKHKQQAEVRFMDVNYLINKIKWCLEQDQSTSRWLAEVARSENSQFDGKNKFLVWQIMCRSGWLRNWTDQMSDWLEYKHWLWYLLPVHQSWLTWRDNFRNQLEKVSRQHNARNNNQQLWRNLSPCAWWRAHRNKEMFFSSCHSKKCIFVNLRIKGIHCFVHTILEIFYRFTQAG